MSPVLRVLSLLWATAILSAFLVAVAPGVPAVVRALMGYRLTPVSGSLSLVTEIAFHNARWVFALAVLSLARARLTRPRRLDAVVYLDAGANAALVGCAIGAYALHSLPYLAHMPVESTAMAVALHAYRVRSSRLFVLALGLVVIAAYCESYLTPQ